MRATLAIFATLAFLLAAPAVSAAPVPSIPLSLFTQLATSAQSAKGIVHFELAQGITTTRIPGTADIRWIVRSGTSATAEFEYTNGQWKSLRLSFSDWIMASFREGSVQAHRQKLSMIVFKNGQPDDYFDDGAQPVGLSLSAFPEVRSHLRVPSGPASLLLASLFVGMKNSPSQPGQGLSPVAVTIQSPGPVAGVVLVLKPGSLLPFSQDPPGQPGAGSWLRLAEPATVSFTALSFIPIESVIKFQLGALATQLADARLSFGGSVLLASNASRIAIDSLDSDTSNPDAAIAIKSGAFSGRLASGSQLQLTRNALGATTFVPQPSGDARIERFVLLIRKNGAGTLTATNMTVPVAGQRATVVFDHLDALTLTIDSTQSPTLHLEQAAWTEGQPPLAHGKLSAFSAAINSGVLAMDRSRLRILRGTVASNGLSIGNASSNTVVGSLQQLTFMVDANSVIDAGAGAAFCLRSGTGSAAGPAQSLVFDSALDGPIGNITITNAAVRNGVLRFGGQALLDISADKAAFTAIHTPLGTDWSMSGTIKVSTGSFLLNTVGTFLIQSGTVAVNDLTMNDSGATGGTLSAVDLAIAPQTITYGDKLAVVALGTSRLRLSQATAMQVANSGNLVGSLSLFVPIFTGRIHFGSVGVVDLNGGNVDFGVNAAADLSARLSLDIDVKVATGRLQILPGSEIVLGEGTIMASALVGSPDIGFVGPIAQADLAIRSASFSFNSGLQFATGTGKFVAKADFKIARDGLSVSGPFSLRTTLDKLRSSANMGLAASGGDLDLELQLLEDHSLVTQASPPSYFHGAGIHFQTPKGDSVDLTLNLENVRLAALAGQPATLISNLRGRFVQFVLNIHTEPKEGYTDKDGEHNNARFFSLTMNAGLDPGQASIVSVDDFTLIAGQPVPPLKPTVHLLLTLPPGDGEHPNSSINEAGNHGGPDRMHNAQEAFTDTFPACRVHIYFLPGTYHVTADLDLTPVWAGGKVKATDIGLTPPITRNENTTTQGWDRDGCDGPFEKIIVVGFAALIGGAIAGPAGGLLLGGLGAGLVNFAEDRLDNWINAQVASRIQSLQFSQ